MLYIHASNEQSTLQDKADIVSIQFSVRGTLSWIRAGCAATVPGLLGYPRVHC